MRPSTTEGRKADISPPFIIGLCLQLRPVVANSSSSIPTSSSSIPASSSSFASASSSPPAPNSSSSLSNGMWKVWSPSGVRPSAPFPCHAVDTRKLVLVGVLLLRHSSSPAHCTFLRCASCCSASCCSFLSSASSAAWSFSCVAPRTRRRRPPSPSRALRRTLPAFDSSAAVCPPAPAFSSVLFMLCCSPAAAFLSEPLPVLLAFPAFPAFPAFSAFISTTVAALPAASAPLMAATPAAVAASRASCAAAAACADRVNRAPCFCARRFPGVARALAAAMTARFFAAAAVFGAAALAADVASSLRRC